MHAWPCTYSVDCNLLKRLCTCSQDSHATQAQQQALLQVNHVAEACLMPPCSTSHLRNLRASCHHSASPAVCTGQPFFFATCSRQALRHSAVPSSKVNLKIRLNLPASLPPLLPPSLLLLLLLSAGSADVIPVVPRQYLTVPSDSTITSCSCTCCSVKVSYC